MPPGRQAGHGALSQRWLQKDGDDPWMSWMHGLSWSVFFGFLVGVVFLFLFGVFFFVFSRVDSVTVALSLGLLSWFS